MAIRRGAWTYERLMEYAEGMQAKLEELYKTSTLQRSADLDRIDRLCVELTEEALAAERGA